MNLIAGSSAAASMPFTALRMPRDFDELKSRLFNAAIASSSPSSVTGFERSTLRIAFAGIAGSDSLPNEATAPIMPKNSIEQMNMAIKVPTITAKVVLRKFFITVIMFFMYYHFSEYQCKSRKFLLLLPP